MALKSTVFKIHLSIADLNRHYYEDHALTLARHPSETDLRMMMRLVAFALNADERLHFTRGLCVDDEPELWRQDYSGDIEHWIDLGQLEENRIRKACSRAEKVSIYTYQRGSALPWLESLRNKIQRFKHLHITHLQLAETDSLDDFVERSMRLNCTIQDEQVLLTKDWQSLTIEAEVLK